MKKEIILTEDPNKELWNQFKRFENFEVCLNYLKKCKKFDYSEKFNFRAKLIKYYITQAREYYFSAREASVLTKPTLLYYGASCLVKALIISKRCYQDDSTGHGIKVHKSNADDLMGFRIKPVKGTFLELYQVLENKNTKLIKSIDFNLEDLFSFIPELIDDFENIFNKKSLAIKVDRIRDEDGGYLFYDGNYFVDVSILNDFFNNIPNFDKYYLPLLVSSKGIVCFKRPQSDEDIVLRNIMGEEFLVSSLPSGEKSIYLSQITVHFLILYLLSMLSRYYVNLWLSEKSSEETRYFYIIEKFLDISERKFPNMILNEILNKEIVFSVEYYKPSSFDFDEIKGMIEEIVTESIEENNSREEKEEIKGGLWMISTMEDIGKLFLKLDDVIEFKNEFDKLYSLVNHNNMFFYNFFHSSLSDRNQFESFIHASLFFFKEFPEDALPLLNMVKTHCMPLALKINFILWVLNNYNHNGEILKLIDLPYKDIFEKFDQKCHLDDDELKKVFEEFFSKNDELFDLILKLRDDFRNSKKYNKYVELSKLDDDESEYYKKAIKSYFYIIKEIIFEVILFDKISIYGEDNVLKFFESNSLISGDNFDIKMIHASINDMHIIKIDYEDCQKYAWISSIIINHYQKKGKIIRIKGEFINDGFGKYSKNMNCSEKIDKLKGFTLFPI